MSEQRPPLMVCDCEGTSALASNALCRACEGGGRAVQAFTSLCASELAVVGQAMSEGPVTIACMQEVEQFDALSHEHGGERLNGAVDLRDRALWSDEGAAAGPKLAALLAEAERPVRPAGSKDIESHGVCLIYGPSDPVLKTAARLSPHLTVTAMVSDTPELLSPPEEFQILRGRVRRASGHFGAFEVVVDRAAAMRAGGRGVPQFDEPRDGGRSECDVIIDLSGAAPLFSAHGKRDGYLRADPADPLAVAEIALEAMPMIGTFEKPLYIDFDPQLCAHSRSGQPGCTRCLDVCPTGAITPNGETVAIDPMICAGCGGCSAVCPSGAASYALPHADDARLRMETMLSAYRSAGGTAPKLFIHDGREGRGLIAAAARHGRGLPAKVIPFEIGEVTQIGHDLLISAFAVGADEACIHLPPRIRREGEADALDGQLAITRAMLEGAGLDPARLSLIETADPDEAMEALYALTAEPLIHAPITPLGDKRSATRLSMQALAPDSEAISLPEGAPYGSVEVSTDACTLCLACVSQCPVGALMDNPDAPQLRLRESACLQCGICEATCPENAITLKPQFDPRASAREPRILHQDEPFPCVGCGKPFGSRGTVERIMEKLGGKHWMFENPERTRIIQMCDDCRVGAVFAQSDNPFDMGERPRVRTTDDYLPESAGKKPKFDA